MMAKEIMIDGLKDGCALYYWVKPPFHVTCMYIILSIEYVQYYNGHHSLPYSNFIGQYIQ